MDVVVLVAEGLGLRHVQQVAQVDPHTYNTHMHVHTPYLLSAHVGICNITTLHYLGVTEVESTLALSGSGQTFIESLKPYFRPCLAHWITSQRKETKVTAT